jgi:uncharacterized protein YecE (DUF72 family)
VPAAKRNLIRVGISGWTYTPWRGVFYPEGLRQADELSFASHQFSTIEVNGSFYSLQQPSSYAAWYRAAPEGFVFSLKGGRYITHIKRLREVRSALANFYASGLFALREKLGPILWQLPPTLRFDAGQLRAFFELLPRNTREMERLAKDHDTFLEGRALVDAQHDTELHYAIEVRHPSFLDAKYVDLLREFSLASCVADSAGRYPVIEDLTGNIAYVRLHGSKQLYESGYGHEELRNWAEWILAWQSGHDAAEPRIVGANKHTRLQRKRSVYVYFDNDIKVHAPFDAHELVRQIQSLGGAQHLCQGSWHSQLAGVATSPR